MLKTILLFSAVAFSPLSVDENISTTQETLTTIATYTSSEGYTLTLDTSDYTFTLDTLDEYYTGTYLVNIAGDIELYLDNGDYLFKVSIVDGTSTFSIYTEISEEEATETIISTIKEWLSEYLSSDLITSIINWAINAGLITFAAGVLIKYKKYKAKSSQEIAKEVEETIKSVLANQFSSLSTEQQTTIINKISEFENYLKVFEQALILAQDKTAEGKKALLELIVSNSNNTETKEVATAVNEKIEQEQAEIAEIQEEVKKDYTPID